MISELSAQYLLTKLPMWDTYKKVSVIPHLPTEDSSKLLEIAKEIDPRYSGTIWCQSCLEDVVRFVFNNFEKTEYYINATKEPEKVIIKQVIGKKKKDN